jgi:D-3-phosphoglycerate dehydrogenase
VKGFLMRNILITTSSFAVDNPGLLTRFENMGLQIILNPYGRKLTEAEVSELIQQHQPLGMIAGIEPLTQQVLDKAQNLKVISRCGIGMDSVDLVAAKNLGIVVTNTPDGPTIAVAELTLGMILSLLRRIHISDAGIRRGDWLRPMGNLLHGKTVGLIGCGRIGYYLTKLLSSFGATVLGCDPVCKRSEYCVLVTLNELFFQSDIVTLHIPYNKENHYFINKERILSMKKGALLINAARGGIVDEDALYDALVSGHLSGAALDCFEQEPYTGPLKNLDNVLLTGHIGSYAKEGRAMMEKQAVENLLRELGKAGIIGSEKQ